MHVDGRVCGRGLPGVLPIGSMFADGDKRLSWLSLDAELVGRPAWPLAVSSGFRMTFC